MKKLLLPIAVIVGIGTGALLACGSSDDPKEAGANIISITCDNYAKCNMLTTDLMGMLGTTADECKQRMSAMPGSGTGTGTATNNCPNTDWNACASAMKALTCEQIKGKASIPACDCK